MTVKLTGLLAALTAVSIAGAAAAEDWRYMNDGPGIVGGVDRDTIRMADGVGFANTMTVFEAGRAGVDYIIMAAEVDCARERFRFTAFTGMGRDGTKRFSEPDPDAAWDAITPASPLSELQAALCDGRVLDSPSAADAGVFVDTARRALARAG